MIDQWLHELESDTLRSKAFGVNILPVFSGFLVKEFCYET